VVTALTSDEIRELFDLRAILEPELIRHSIPRMTRAHLDQISRLFAEHEQEFAPTDVDRWGELNTRFHLALFAASDRGKTLEIVRSLLLNTDRYTRLVLVLTEDVLNEGREDHRKLLDCCLRGSVDEGIDLVRKHAGHCSVSLLEALERKRAQAG
jgi:DNA-binding GntR family transcriptional regulator